MLLVCLFLLFIVCLRLHDKFNYMTKINSWFSFIVTLLLLFFFIMEDHPEDIASNDGNRAGSELKSTCSPNFKDVLKSDTFVDKSAFILAVLQTHTKSVVLCTAPRRFGKTVNLDMMQRFLELEVDENGIEKTTILEEKDNYKLFNSARFKLKVMQNKKFVKTHFGQYPIIKINFLCVVDVQSESDAVTVCREAISRAFREHKYLYKSKLSSLEEDEKKFCEQWCNEFNYEGIPYMRVVKSLGILARFLNKFHKRNVFLLVDEYDSIVSNALYNVKNADPQKELEDLVPAAEFPIKVIGHALKNYDDIIEGALITGILDVAGIAISSLLGNVMRRQFGTKNLCQDFYGFNEDEVCTLFDKWSVDEKLKKKAMAKYSGYVNGEMKSLYNPQVVAQFLINLALGEGALKNYWQQSGYIRHLYELLRKDDLRRLLNQLLQGAVNFETSIIPLEISDLKSLHDLLIHSNLTCDIQIVVKFLISLGYLTYSEDDNKLKIPNGELLDEFTRRLQNYFSVRYGIDDTYAQACSRSFSELARLCDEDDSLAEFKEELANFQINVTGLLRKSTLIDPLNEATLRTVVASTCTRGGFFFGDEIIIPNYSTRIDVILYNDTFGGIVEMKCMPQTSKDALKRIFTNHYCSVFTMKKYFNDRQKSPPLSLVMGMHVDFEKKASVLCLRKKDIIDVLDDLKVEAMQSLASRIEIAVNTIGEPAINAFLEKAIGTS